MKSINIIFQLLLFGLSSFQTSAQKKCSYQIDTKRILANLDLDTFLKEIDSDTFLISKQKRDIPKFIMKELKCLIPGYDLANPDEPYNSSDFIIKNLPRRQLIFLAKSDDILIMQYFKGGIGRTEHILLVMFKDRKIVNLWKGMCSQDLQSINQLISYVQKNREREWGLNTNMIYF